MKTAVVIIDVQNYFINEETIELPSKIAHFIQNNKFDYILFTRFVNSEKSNYIKLLNWRKCFSPPDIDIHPAFERFITSDNVFSKSSYSVFKATGFTNFLTKNNIKELFLCGIDTDSCVLASAYDAFDLGYNVRVLEDLCLSHSGDDFHSSAIKIINKSIQKEGK